MAEPTLMFCVGATKAGTSWLHRYISNHDQCHMRPVKELHYFDAVEFDDWEPWIEMVRDRAARSRKEADGLDAAKPFGNCPRPRVRMNGAPCWRAENRMIRLTLGI